MNNSDIQNQGFNNQFPQNQNQNQGFNNQFPQNQNNVNPYQTTNYIPPNQYMAAGPMTAQTQAFPIGGQHSPSPAEINSLAQSLKTDPVYINCPHCSTQGQTRTEQSFSLLACCCCCCTGVICWVIFQALRNKEMNCTNSKHYCIKCGKFIGTKEAC